MLCLLSLQFKHCYPSVVFQNFGLGPSKQPSCGVAERMVCCGGGSRELEAPGIRIHFFSGMRLCCGLLDKTLHWVKDVCRR